MGLELALVGDVGVAAASGQGDFVEEWGAGVLLCVGTRLRKDGRWGTNLSTLDTGGRAVQRMVDCLRDLPNFTIVVGGGREIVDTKQVPDACVEQREDTDRGSDSFDLEVGVEDLVHLGNIPVFGYFNPDDVAVWLDIGEVRLNTSLLEALRPATKVPRTDILISLGCTQV